MLNISILIVDSIVRLNMKEDSEKGLSVQLIVNQYFLMKLDSSFKKNVVIAKVNFWVHSYAKQLKTSKLNLKEQLIKAKMVLY